MGLGFTDAARRRSRSRARASSATCSARFHPHGDQAAYDALVRMAQDFSLRYPLIDGQGNFGIARRRRRRGDALHRGAAGAASRDLLLDEIDEGTVDFMPNYDGSTEEPQLLPARLPFVLLNGASGIAVGLATEIPSHNLREVADACGRADQATTSSATTSCSRCCPAPTIPAAARSSARRATSRDAYAHRPRLAQGARALEDRGPRARPVAARRHRAAAGRRARRRCSRRSRS